MFIELYYQVTQHFKVQWIQNALNKWTRGHCANCVINNNGLEGTNALLKKEVTQRKLRPVLTFFVEIMKWLKEKSLRCNSLNPNHTPFTTVHTITTNDWVEAYRWEKDISNQVRVVGENYVCVRENREHLTDAKAASFVTAFTDFTFVSFDNYASVPFRTEPQKMTFFFL